MQIKTNLVSIPTDNDVEYIDFISTAVKHSDPDASVMISKSSYNISVIIYPSKRKFKEDIIKDVLDANHRLGIKIKFSSSLGVQKSVSYVINMEE